MDKKFRLPKDGFIDEQDVEGHRATDGGDGTDGLPTPTDAQDEDVEAHRGKSPDGFTVLPAPPSIGLRRTPGHGGELTADEDDTEGHRVF